MYSPRALKIAVAIMYQKQLIHRAKTIPLGDLEKEVKDYELEMQKPPAVSSFASSFIRDLSKLFWGDDSYFKFDQYQVNRKVLDERRDEIGLSGGNA